MMAGPSGGEQTFFPKGAIAFFVAMVVFYATFWFAMYALMTGRG